MVKTQIQVPEKQYQALRTFAAEREWSMAETFRRGAELLLEVYPHHLDRNRHDWHPPSSGCVGWRGLEPAALKDAVFEDCEPKL
jgi:hypothetical protein